MGAIVYFPIPPTHRDPKQQKNPAEKASIYLIYMRTLTQNRYGRGYKDHPHKSGCGMTE